MEPARITSEWVAAQEEFWQEVHVSLKSMRPSLRSREIDFAECVRRLRQLETGIKAKLLTRLTAGDNQPVELFFHQNPREVAERIADGGYEDIFSKPKGLLERGMQYLKKLVDNPGLVEQ